MSKLVYTYIVTSVLPFQFWLNKNVFARCLITVLVRGTDIMQYIYNGVCCDTEKLPATLTVGVFLHQMTFWCMLLSSGQW